MVYEVIRCIRCGHERVKLNGETYVCEGCGAKFAKKSAEEDMLALKQALVEETKGAVNEVFYAEKMEKLASRRQLLWTEVSKTYISSKAILEVCHDVKKLLPNDFAANFYEVANKGNAEEVNSFLRKIDVVAQADHIDDVVGFMIKSLKSEYLLSVAALIERAYRSVDLKKYDAWQTSFEREAAKVNAGVYNLELPRDVFIAYSSEDMKGEHDHVAELTNALEEQGISCFVALRNLQHGSGAVENYQTALNKAMNKCKIFLLISSKNSRKLGCDTIRNELPYVQERDVENAPSEYKYNYESMPMRYKKPRVEYRLDDVKNTATDGMIKEFFGTLQYLYTVDEAVARVAEYLRGGWAKEERRSEVKSVLERAQTKAEVKYCVACGAENAKNAKFCSECGESVFSSDGMKYCANCGAKSPLKAKRCNQCGKAEFVYTEEEFRQKQEAELRQKEEERRKQEELRRKEEEERRKQEEIRKKEEEERRKQEELRRKEEEERRKQEELRRKEEEERRKREEEERKKQEELRKKEEAEGNRIKTLKDFEIKNGVLIKYTGKGGDVVIPDSVTSIGQQAFLDSHVKTVVIPNSVKSIGDFAFDNCSRLTSVTMGDGVTSISDIAFYGCSSLTSVTVSVGNATYQSIGGNLYSKDGKRLIKYVIGKTATLFTVPDGVKSIGNSAFAYCSSLTSITIPDSVTNIGNYAFAYCSSLTSITIPDSVTNIGNYAFDNCSSLTSITIPDSVTNIGNYVFYGCSGLTSITIPDSVTNVRFYAFHGCSRLTSIIIPDSVTSIEESAFAYCSRLTSVTIPKSVTSIGRRAFNGCGQLTIYYDGKEIPETWTKEWNSDGRPVVCKQVSKKTEKKKDPSGDFVIENGVLKKYNGIGGDVVIPDSVTSIGQQAFLDSHVKTVVIPNSVKSIGNSAFYGCSGLTSIIIPDSVTSIGWSAFYGCSGLTSIVIPDNVTSICNAVFSGCSRLTSITIGDGVTSIGDYAFENCGRLTSIIIPDSVTSICNAVFCGCSSLKSVTIGGGVKSIGGSPFYNCSRLTSVTVSVGNATYQSIDGNLYSKDGKRLIKYAIGKTTTSFTVPNGVKSIGDYAFCGCSKLTSITISDGVTSIGSSAFDGCSSLKSITIPDSVTSIGSYAFRNCSRLKSITIPDSVTDIGNFAFSGCCSLTIYCKGKAIPNTWYKDWNPDGRPMIFLGYRELGRCQYCGGEFKGVFVKKCSQCGKKKDY